MGYNTSDTPQLLKRQTNMKLFLLAALVAVTLAHRKRNPPPEADFDSLEVCLGIPNLRDLVARAGAKEPLSDGDKDYLDCLSNYPECPDDASVDPPCYREESDESDESEESSEEGGNLAIDNLKDMEGKVKPEFWVNCFGMSFDDIIALFEKAETGVL